VNALAPVLAPSPTADERPAVPAEVKLPTVLRTHADGQATIAADGATIGEIFGSLVERYPGLKANLIADDGGLHKFVNVYVDDDDIRYLDGLDTKVPDGATISILPAVAGGA
jgi:molybdopterin converting factor small subunit